MLFPGPPSMHPSVPWTISLTPGTLPIPWLLGIFPLVTGIVPLPVAEETAVGS